MARYQGTERDVDAILESNSIQVKDHLSQREVVISAHAYARSQQRRVSLDLVRYVIENGTQELSENDSWKFTFGGVVVITDCNVSTVKTVWPEQGYGVDIDKVPITPVMEAEHKRSMRKLRSKEAWTSHTVAVIDQSGSMRKVDMDSKVMRSDVVWLALAVTVVANRIVSGERKDTDALSIVSMREGSEILIHARPFDWILYNDIVDLLRESKPSLGGCYIPAIDTAESLLVVNQNKKCAKTLMFLSDGRPSDKLRRGDCGGYELNMIKHTKERIGRLASQFGKRLVVCCAAIGTAESDEFRVIKSITDEAGQYGCPVVFQKASLSASVLATTLATMSSSTTVTMTQITEEVGDGSNGKQREYRKYTIMPLRDVGATEITETWKTLTFGFFSGNMRTIVRTEWTENGWQPYHLNDMFHDPCATGVAFESRWFGEGAERLVKEFREKDRYGRFVGPRLVAKDSKFLVNQESQDGARGFHTTFCKTQMKAKEIAEKFNKVLENLDGAGDTIARVEFLECSVYMLQKSEEGERLGYLVEPMLDVKKFKYQKFNDNKGGVFHGASVAAPFASVGGIGSIAGRGASVPSKRSNTYGIESLIGGMGMMQIAEGDESEEEESDSDNDGLKSMLKDMYGSTSRSSSSRRKPPNPDTDFDMMDIPQAFSCFSYHLSGRRMLICDLQGILNTSRKPHPVFELTDPVIHRKEQAGKRDYGRTDRGEEGIRDFFKTHTCSRLCKMLQKRRMKKAFQPDMKTEKFPLRFQTLHGGWEGASSER